MTSQNGANSGSYPNSSEELVDEPIDFGVYFRLIRRRWLTSLVVFLLVFGLATVKTLRQRKIFESQTKLVVVTKSPSIDTSSDSILGSLDALKQGRNVDTQVELIDSPDLLGKAFRRKLSESYWTDGVRDGWDAEDILKGFGTVNPPLWAADVKSKPDTDVILITTHAYTPFAAAHFANAIANEYEDEDLARNQKATRAAGSYVQKRLMEVGEKLSQSSASLANFQRASHLLSPTDQATTLVSNAADLQTQYAGANGDLIAAKNRLALLTKTISQVRPSIQASTTIAENPEFAQVQTQIVQLEGQITEQSHEFKPIAPEIKLLKNELKEEQDHLRRLSRTLVSSSSTEANPVRLKLLGDYADAESNVVVAKDHADALKGQVDKFETQLAAMPENERKFSRLDLQVELLKNTYSLLSERNATLGIQEQSTLSNVIVAAYGKEALKPSLPKVFLNLAVAFVASLLASVFVTLALDHFDKKLHRPEEAEELTGLTALTYVPEATSVTGRILLNEAEPAHAFLESYRLLRNNIEFATLDSGFKVLAVTSASMSDGKSTNSINLAIAFAKDRKRVLLVDLDLRRPTIHTLTRSSNAIGFTTAVRDQTSLSEAIQATEWEGLSTLTSGPLPPDPTEFLNSPKSRGVIKEAASQFDLVILDAPPCAGLSDVQVISKMCDGVVVVVSLDVTEKPMIQSAMRTLRQAKTPLLGLIVNRMKRSNGGSYGNKGYYGYDNYSQDEKIREKRPKARSGR
jgi:succinoglycan biosynthesis transport protein ExoP